MKLILELTYEAYALRKIYFLIRLICKFINNRKKMFRVGKFLDSGNPLNTSAWFPQSPASVFLLRFFMKRVMDSPVVHSCQDDPPHCRPTASTNLAQTY